MKKTFVLWVMLDLVFLVVFNVLFFLLGGTEHNVAVWLSYGFIHLAYLFLIATPFLIKKGKSAAVFGFSLYVISSIYFFIEFVVGVLFILIAPDGFKLALSIQIVILGIYAVLLLSHMIANENTAAVEQKRQIERDLEKKSSYN